MGLDCSHNAWHGAYSAFMTWRKKLAQVAGLPPLELMEGFYSPLNASSGMPCTLYHGIHTNDPAFGPGTLPHMADLNSRLPISWGCLRPSALNELLWHSDCDGDIPADRCGPIADALEALLPLLPDAEAPGHIRHWQEKTKQFIAGLRAASEAGEPLDFH